MRTQCRYTLIILYCIKSMPSSSLMSIYWQHPGSSRHVCHSTDIFLSHLDVNPYVVLFHLISQLYYSNFRKAFPWSTSQDTMKPHGILFSHKMTLKTLEKQMKYSNFMTYLQWFFPPQIQPAGSIKLTGHIRPPSHSLPTAALAQETLSKLKLAKHSHL